MIAQEFDFHAPAELPEVFRLMERAGESAKVLAGGMSLVPMMTLGLVQPQAIISLNHLPGLDYVVEGNDIVRIGAMTRHQMVETHPLIRQFCPLLAETASRIGDVQVRNRGTIGGSLAHADPAADYPPTMLVAGARFVLQSARGKRTVEARDFFIGLMQTAMQADELLVEVSVPKHVGAGWSCQKLHRVEGTFAIVNAAALIGNGGRNARLAIGAAGPTPVVIDLAPHLAGGVTDKAIEAIGDAAYAATSEASQDINGSAEYRREMARVYARRVVKSAAAGL
jgi:carbon-monoxide dehydrogenase medium subunit